MLFDGAKIGKLNLKNRIVFPPMATSFAAEGGFVSDQQIEYYARRAAGGAGLIIVEYCAVDPVGVAIPRQLRIFDDGYIPGLARLARGIQAEGAKAAIQLHHGGRQTSIAVSGHQPVAPSPIPCPQLGGQPRELATEEVRFLVEQYAEGARRAKEAGFDAVEFHGAHGYLICQFFSARSNRRTDEYGGDVARRARFGIEILQRTREKVGPDFPLLFRISADEHLEGGLTTAETTVIAKLLQEAGADAIDVSAGAYGSAEWTSQPMLMPLACLAPHAAEIKRAVSVPVIVAGRINSAKVAERVLAEGSADFIAMGRALLADPDLPIKSAAGREQAISRCLACNTCMDLVFKMLPIDCILNPEVQGRGMVMQQARMEKKVLIIGANPAGFEAARVAKLRGHDVTLYDENQQVGARWAWRIQGYVHQQLKVLKELGVTVELGVKVDPASIARFHPDVVLATPPSRPIIPLFAQHARGLRVKTVDDALDQPRALGPQVVVLGGSNLACEAAETLVRQGKKVTIIDRSRIIGYGLEPIVRGVVTTSLRKRGVEMITKAEVLGLDEGAVLYQDINGQDRRTQADAVVLALGYEPDEESITRLREAGVDVQTLPTCHSPRFVIDAIREGAAIAREI